MDGQRNSIYENGCFQLTIDFPKDFPKTNPEIRISNKIYHLQVSPSNGHVCAGFLSNWNPTTTISECLVGIYLFLLLPQNPYSPYSGEMAREYKDNLLEFNRKAREWTLKYAPQKIGDLKMIYENRFLCYIFLMWCRLCYLFGIRSRIILGLNLLGIFCSCKKMEELL